MVKAIGIDPGTKSFDVCGLDEDRVILDKTIQTKDIVASDTLLSDTIADIHPDIVVGPSGYGIPVKSIRDIDDTDMFLMSLNFEKSVLGMRKSITALRKNNMPVWFIPGIIHLPTVPEYRKFNRIDMGTPDKLCCCALAVADQAERLGTGYEDTSFILIEVGYGYTAAAAVSGGKIIDGIGGTGGNMGFLSPGCMDAELAYLLGGFEKGLLFNSGAGSFIGETGDAKPEQLSPDIPGKNNAFFALVEGAVKNVLALYSSVQTEEIIISGRLSRIKMIRDAISGRIEDILPAAVVPLGSLAGVKHVKEASQGAAIIASGLAGGRYRELIDHMEIKEAKGTSLDHLNPDILRLLKRKLQVSGFNI